MEVFLIMPTTPEGKAKLSKELAKFHAEQALKMVQKLPCSTEQKLELSYTINIQHLLSLVKLLNPRRIHRNVRL